MGYETIESNVEDGRAEITMDRPEVLNALDRTMTDELNQALAAAQEADDVYVILLSGAGRSFCAGADVGQMGQEEDRLASGAYLWKVQSIVRELHHGPKPVVAAVDGPAVGVGADLALACDLRVMGESGFIREEFVNFGLVPGDGGAWLLPRLVGESKAKELLLTAKTVDAAEAVDLGLATEVVADDECLDAARTLSNEIRDKPAPGVQRTKALVDVTQSFDEYAQRAIEAQWACATSPEHEEAVRAYREDREPEYDR